ncbi:YuiB family protein [Heyndrickxia acidiproducens]|uniref:YuiB family protein n=1 Tax=Heyndrickxia acidiproducens TaxID=1121084 RepID=UPI000475D0BA|nr:YuiB family protein [Heyndrickxia acidiproducens]
MSIPVLIISMVLFLVLFFGIGFITNMLLRMTWVLAFAYPIIALLIIDQVKFSMYFTDPQAAFRHLGDKLTSLYLSDILILSSGLAGAVLAGIAIRLLRKSGYQMF